MTQPVSETNERAVCTSMQVWGRGMELCGRMLMGENEVFTFLLSEEKSRPCCMMDSTPDPISDRRPPQEGTRQALAAYPTTIAEDLEVMRAGRVAKGSVEEAALLVSVGLRGA